MALSGGRVFGATSVFVCLFVSAFPLDLCKGGLFSFFSCVGFCSVGGQGLPIGSSEARGVRRGSVRCDLCCFLFFFSLVLFSVESVGGLWNRVPCVFFFFFLFVLL